jgi:hypothetical protein
LRDYTDGPSISPRIRAAFAALGRAEVVAEFAKAQFITDREDGLRESLDILGIAAYDRQSES